MGVVISGLLSATGPPATVLDAWRDGLVDLVISPMWLAEFDRVVARPRIAKYVTANDAAVLRAALLRQSVVLEDPPALHGVTPDPGDDYLVALARAAAADALVSGDRHLTELENPHPPVLTPRRFVDEVLPPPPW